MLDKKESVFRENDADAVGQDTFGDALTAITVRNDGTLPDAEIRNVTLLANGTTVATNASPTNGTWVLQPDNGTAEFGPAGNGTDFTIETTLASNATGGETVEIGVPPLVDNGTQGAFDPGDRGVFFEQDSPIGNLGPGPTLTVATESSGSATDTVQPVAIDISVPAANRTTATGPIPIEIRTNASTRPLEASLRYTSNNTTVAETWITVDDSGQADVSFDSHPGRFHVVVREPESDSRAVSAPITIEKPGSVSFENETYSTTRGAVFDIGVQFRNAPSARLRIEDPRGEVIDVVPVVPADESGRYQLAFDTERVGLGANGSGTGLEIRGPGSKLGRGHASAGRGNPIGASPNRSARSGSRPGKPASAGGVGADSDARPNESNENTGHGATPEGAGTNKQTGPPIIRGPPPRQGPGIPASLRALGAGTYELSLEYRGNVTDTATLQITDSWSGSVRTKVLPAATNLSAVESVEELATTRSDVAVGDTVVVVVNTTGLGAYPGMVPIASGSGGSSNAPGFAAVREAGSPRSDGFEPSQLRRLGPRRNGSNGSTGTLRFALRTRADGTDLVVPGDRYGAAFTLTERSPFVEGLGTGDAIERESVLANLTVVPARANFSGLSANETLDLPPASNATIAGTTTVAPGTVATISVEGTSENDSTTVESETTIGADGSYETDVDMSDFESGDNYTVSVSTNGERISPLRTGQVSGVQTQSFAAAGGGGGGAGSGYDDSGSGAGSARTTSTPIQTLTQPPPEREIDPIDSAMIDRLREDTWEPLPKPLRVGLQALLVAGLGLLTLLVIVLGVRRL